jgi:hypothetical protein
MAEKVKALGTDAETPLMKQYNQIKSKVSRCDFVVSCRRFL